MRKGTLLVLAIVCLGATTFAQRNNKMGCDYSFTSSNNSKQCKAKKYFIAEAYLMPTVGFGQLFQNGHMLMGEGLGIGIQWPKRFALTFHFQHAYTNQNFANYVPPGTIVDAETDLSSFPDLNIKGNMLEGGFRLRYFAPPVFNAGLVFYPQVGLFFAGDKSTKTYTMDGADVTPATEAGKQRNYSHTFVDLGVGVEKPIKKFISIFGELNARLKADDIDLLHIYDQGVSLHAGVRFRL